MLSGNYYWIFGSIVQSLSALLGIFLVQYIFLSNRLETVFSSALEGSREWPKIMEKCGAREVELSMFYFGSIHKVYDMNKDQFPEDYPGRMKWRSGWVLNSPPQPLPQRIGIALNDFSNMIYKRIIRATFATVVFFSVSVLFNLAVLFSLETDFHGWMYLGASLFVGCLALAALYSYYSIRSVQGVTAMLLLREKRAVYELP